MTLGERSESCKGYARMAYTRPGAGHVLIKWQPQQRISQLQMEGADGGGGGGREHERVNCSCSSVADPDTEVFGKG